MIGRYVVVYDISFVVARSDGRGERKIFVKVQEQRMQGGFPGIVRMDYGAVPAVGVLQTSAVGLCDCRLMCTFIDIGQGHGDKRGSNFSMTLLPFLSARDASVDEDPCRLVHFLSSPGLSRQCEATHPLTKKQTSDAPQAMVTKRDDPSKQMRSAGLVGHPHSSLLHSRRSVMTPARLTPKCQDFLSDPLNPCRERLSRCRISVSDR